MARPTKQGLDYFPLDSQFLSDIKVRKIMKAQGVNAISVLISLLCNIYRDNGYYIKRDDDVSFLISDEIGVKEEYVNEVIDKAIQVGFFDKNMFEKFQILTSNGIQKRFFEATERRKVVQVIDEFRINANNNEVNVNINPINDNRSTQSKVKESKVNKSKVDVDKKKYPPTTTRDILFSKPISINQWAMITKVDENRIKECIIEFSEFKERTGENEKWQNDSDLIKNFEFWLNSNARAKIQKNQKNQSNEQREIYRNA